jgi:CPA2 family monovalent cation:H+ antiporter-2
MALRNPGLANRKFAPLLPFLILPMHLPLLPEILVLLGFSVVIVFMLQRLRLPSIIGLLITGVIIGPYGFGLVNAVEEVEVLSEIGVIFLLFVIGMELSIKQLASIKRTVMVGGMVQVGLTVGVAAVVYVALGHSWAEAVFIGFLFSLSSTAIVLKTLQDRREMAAPHAKNALAILIFQDIIVVPMMLLTPIMAGGQADVSMEVFSLLVKSAVVIAVTVVSARYLVPRLLHAIAKTNNKELFLLLTFTLCFAVAFLTSQAGLSLALGAFLAGLIISESEYSHHATSIILPFRELFTSFFFVSVGMLLDLGFFVQHILVITALVLAVFVVKSLIASAAVVVLRYPTRTVLLTGLSLFQIGEFAFILSKVGISHGLISAETNQYFLSVSIVSMLLTPFVIIASHHITDRVEGVTRKLGLANRQAKGTKEEAQSLSNHLVIVGYGVNGSNLAKAAAASGIPFFIIEMNPETVQREKKKGLPIVFGDARHDHILDLAHLVQARAAVIAISDGLATKAIIKSIRSHSESLYLIVRTRYVAETSELLALGADEVIPEEFETSVQIFYRVLQNFLVPQDDIDAIVDTVRADNYQLLKEERARPRAAGMKAIPDFDISCVRIRTDGGGFIGKSLEELDLRKRYGINIIGIRRGEVLLESVGPDVVLKPLDHLYILGNAGDIERFSKATK